jgi:pilus assembly protein CpaF
MLTIEDTAELQLQQIHVGRMESRPPNVEGKGAVTQRDCLTERAPDASRPHHRRRDARRGSDRHASGHEHRPRRVDDHDPRQLRPRRLSRLENMVAMAGIEMPIKAVRAQIASAVNLIVQASRLQDGSRRMVSITEVTGMEGEVISMQEVFRYQRTGLRPDGKIIGHFTACGVRSHLRRTFPPVGLRPAGGHLRTRRRGVNAYGTLDRTAHLRASSSASCCWWRASISPSSASRSA